MRRRHLAELFFFLEPHGHRIDADVLAGQARDEQFTAVLGLEQGPKDVRDLESPFVIYASLFVASKHSKPLEAHHFSPQFSTEIVGEAQVDVNRKIHPVSKLRLIFAF